MNIGLSTSVIQRGQTGVAQYVFALLRALLFQRCFVRGRQMLPSNVENFVAIEYLPSAFFEQ